MTKLSSIHLPWPAHSGRRHLTTQRGRETGSVPHTSALRPPDWWNGNIHADVAQWEEPDVSCRCLYDAAVNSFCWVKPVTKEKRLEGTRAAASSSITAGLRHVAEIGHPQAVPEDDQHPERAEETGALHSHYRGSVLQGSGKTSSITASVRAIVRSIT